MSPTFPRAVRELLLRSEYSADGIARIGIDVGMGVRAPDVPVLLRALEPVEPLATLVRLFVLGVAVREAALPEQVRDAAPALHEAGLTRRAGDRVEPIVRLTPWRGLILAHDPDPPGDFWAEHVSGPTPAADSLLRLVSANGGRALDVGTGCGVFALALAGGQSTVVATDLNPAAVRYAALNAALNDVLNLETRAGNLLEPVAGRSFDLIVSNPPFVISPDSAFLFRHSEFGRDEISRELVRSAAGHLAEGGFAYLLVNWVQPTAARWTDVLAEWLEDTGCDAVCLLHGIEDPLSYAVRWNGREQQLRPERHGATLDRWLAHFRTQGVAAIGSGAVILRRRTGRPWLHGLDLAGDSRGHAGPHVQAIFAARDLLTATGDGPSGDARLLSAAVRMRHPHRLVQTLVTRSGEYVGEPAVLALDEGLALSVAVEPDMIPVLLRLDGAQVGLDIAREIADATGQDVDATGAQVAAFLRRLLSHGMLEPVASRNDESHATFPPIRAT
ncbi:MAG TPA: class I SAM-dependent methyltransferase [Patescibacteria group bacterium]|nr:class I SAM-dependent methyltransferase [Patescibacteria group bacterium]